MRNRLFSAIVALAIAAGGLVAYDSSTEPAPRSYEITADVEQAPNLFAGGRVMVRGVQVGEISEVTPRPDGVRVAMAIDEGVKIPVDARLTVVPITVISDRYVQLYPQYTKGPSLEPGAHLGTHRTTIPAELDEVFAQLKGLLKALEPNRNEERGPLAELIDALDKTVDGRTNELAGTLEGSATVLESFADSQEDIRGLVENLDRLFITLARRSGEIGLVNERFEVVAEALAGDRRNLEGTTENLAFLSDQVTDLIGESGDRLADDLVRLDRVLRGILRHEDSLVEGMKWTNVIAQALGATDANGKGLFAYSGRQAEPGTPGAEYNYRLDTRDTVACERIEVVINVQTAFIPFPTREIILDGLLDFIPDEFDDDLRFLLEQLAPLCSPKAASVWEESEPLTAAEKTRLNAVLEDVGRARFERMLARWLSAGVPGATE